MNKAVVVVVLGLAVALSGCEINGNDALYPGASVWQAQDKGFHFHYMQPPWRIKPPEKGLLVRMLVDGFMIYTPNSDSITYHLEVSYHGNKSTELAAKAVKAKLVKDKHTVTADLVQVRTLTGEQGWDLHTSKPGFSSNLHYRNTFFEDENGKVVRFSLIGQYRLDEQDIQDLILSYSATADDGTEVPERKADARVKDGGTAKDSKVGE